MNQKHFLIILFLALSYNLNAQTQWNWQMPQPNGNSLEDVKFFNSSTGYACGYSGTILKTTNGGNNWLNLPTNVTYLFRSIYVIDNENAIACGDSGKIIKTTNGGNNWNLINTASTGILHGITFVNSTTGYVCGVGGLILKSTNSGLNWTNLNSSTGAILYSIRFANENTGYIGGGRILIKTTNAGINWINTNLIVNDPFGQVFDISVLDSTNLWGIIIFDDKVVYSSNGGAVWNYYDLILPGASLSDNPYSLSFININTGYIVTSLGLICKSTDSGQNWNQDSTFKFKYPRAQVLKSLDVKPEYFYAVGYGGTIVKSTNSGSNYFIQSGYKDNLLSTYFINENTGLVCGSRGEFYKTINGGVNWTRKNLNTDKNLNSMIFLNDQTGYIAGDTGLVLKTTNSGENWFNLSTGRNNIFNDVFFVNQVTGYLCGTQGLIMKTTNEGLNWIRLDSVENNSFSEIYFVNDNTGIAAGGSACLRTTNAGANWTIYSNMFCHTIHFVDESTGYLAGTMGRVFKTTNSGQNWTQTFTRSGWTFEAIYFENEMEGIGIGSTSQLIGGLTVKTTNGGLNWMQMTITNSTLTDLSFLNGETGYISGGSGTLLKTTNAGLTFIEENHNVIVSEYELRQNYPNPFNPVTTFEFNILHSDFAKLSVYDITGKEVAVLLNRQLPPGEYKIIWDASVHPSGVYFYTLQANNFSQTKKMILMK